MYYLFPQNIMPDNHIETHLWQSYHKVSEKDFQLTKLIALVGFCWHLVQTPSVNGSISDFSNTTHF